MPVGVLKDHRYALHKKHIFVQRHLPLTNNAIENDIEMIAIVIAIIFSNHTEIIFNLERNKFYTRTCTLTEFAQ